MSQLDCEQSNTNETYSHSGCHPGLYFHAGIPASAGINAMNAVSTNRPGNRSHANNDGI
jgi:hypothetical protein